MGHAKLKADLAIDEYLKGEELSPIRHEYLYGKVYAMAGTSQNHNRIIRNFSNRLFNALSKSPCEVYSENIKVSPSEEIFYYPDVIVTCEGEFKNKYVCDSPTLIVEVTSPSTAQTDRREKLFAYQKIASVHEIVIVDQELIAIELHRRLPDGKWAAYNFDESDLEFYLESVDLTLHVSEVY
ncbi:Uma2 family endonuclease [soil metagenome]